VDFLIKRKKEFGAVQVCYSLHDYETRQREIRALHRCMEETGIQNGFILTYNEQGVDKSNGHRIEIKPVWRYLLEEE